MIKKKSDTVIILEGIGSFLLLAAFFIGLIGLNLATEVVPALKSMTLVLGTTIALSTFH